MSHSPAGAHEHPDAALYVKIGVVLAIITVVEVAIYYIPALFGILIPALIIMSTVKFILVVGYYMHLKFDDRMFTGFFLGGLGIATGTILGLMALFENF